MNHYHDDEYILNFDGDMYIPDPDTDMWLPPVNGDEEVNQLDLKKIISYYT